MKQKKIKFVIEFLLIALLFTGCIGVDRSFRSIRNYVLESSGGKFEKEFEFSLGSITIGMAEIVVNMADTDEPIEEILSEIDNVQVGVYNNISGTKIKSNLEELKFLTNKMKNAGWDCIVRSLNKNEMTAVFVRFYEDKLNQLFVISLNNNEMVIVEILGNLNKVIEIAIREKGLDFAMKH
ncbi:MAG: DUF4252 domain-containing protein [Bacteroidetes bacterium]|nr:DUF4252 domain-containing protein [Bacteroidota bacterium]MBU1116781.1 DUF4252 domain-containing protein [Bacteroidota bacterium]MBU1798380.1 DUF4252 domain-containing protein [Bacteroidota bacterium]